MPFLDVPAPEGEASTSQLPPLNFSVKPGSGGRAGAKLKEIPVTPLPGFVLKTLLTTPLSHPSSPARTKIFINVSHASEVPVPTAEEEQRGIVHCVVGEIRETFDKKGTQALVTDGILPTSYLIKCKRDKSFKQWLIQVVLEKVEERYGIELSRDYTEPNIPHKGDLVPRLAVLPVYEANGSGAPKIVEVDETSEVLKAAAATILPESRRVDVEMERGRGRGNEKMKPKHEFELVDLGQGRKGFIMLIQLPEEPPSKSNLSDIQLSLSPSHLTLSTSLYALDTELPRDIRVDSVSLSGEGGGVEWSREEKALRVWGEVV